MNTIIKIIVKILIMVAIAILGIGGEIALLFFNQNLAMLAFLIFTIKIIDNFCIED